MLTRTYPGVERGARKDGLKAYTIQVFDKPRQILTLQIRKSISELAPAKAAAELFVKLR